MVVLQGLHRQPDDVRMPGFAKELSDQQIATLGNYLTQRWGNPKARISVEQVKALRSGAWGSTLLLTLARVGIAVAAVVALVIVVVLGRKVFR